MDGGSGPGRCGLRLVLRVSIACSRCSAGSCAGCSAGQAKPTRAALSPRDRDDLSEMQRVKAEYVDDEAFHEDGAEEAIFDDSLDIPSPN